MITRSLVFIMTCFSFLLMIKTMLPKAHAIRKIPNIDEYMIEDERTHTRQNYVMQRRLQDEARNGIDNVDLVHENESFETDTNPEELPAMIVDYANMIRNDIILLDNSVETRTRKRGNIKKLNQAIPEPECGCKSSKGLINFGSNHFPQFVESVNCSSGFCTPPYRCKENYYYITVLRKKTFLMEESPVKVPTEFQNRWVARHEPIVTACVCKRDSINNE